MFPKMQRRGMHEQLLFDGLTHSSDKGCGMKKLLQYSSLALVLALGSGTSAHAETVSLAYGGTLDQVITFLFGWLIDNGSNHHTSDKPNPPKTNIAPEIDPTAAMGALMLVGGMLTVIRSRRR
jgi:hypothetical protein